MADQGCNLCLLGFSKILLMVIFFGVFFKANSHGWSIECYEDPDVSLWNTVYEWYPLLFSSYNGTKCSIRCPLHCTCSLGNFSEVVRACANENISVARASYPSNVTCLSWTNSRLSNITKDSFEDFADTLKVLNLNKNRFQYLEHDVFERLIKLIAIDLRNNILKQIQQHTFRGLDNLQILDFDRNILKEIQPAAFEGVNNLRVLALSRNMLKGIQPGMFRDLQNLEFLSLFDNRLTDFIIGVRELLSLVVLNLSHNPVFDHLFSDTFQSLAMLQGLLLRNISLHFLPVGIFQNLKELLHLDLSDNNLKELGTLVFHKCTLLETLNLTHNPLQWIEENAFVGLNVSTQVFVDDYASCCFVVQAICQSMSPRSPFLTCERLLPYNVLRVGIWIVCIFTILFNVLGSLARCKQRQQTKQVQFLLITNLSISDFLMGVYLIILLSADLYYKDYFPSHSEAWRNSNLCKIAGFLSVLSSEASVFFITMISFDRFVAIKYPFRVNHLGMQSAVALIAFLWLIALSISITSLVLSETDSNIYAISDICVGLPISRFNLYTKTETSVQLSKSFKDTVLVSEYEAIGTHAAHFSIAIFIVLNLLCFSVVGLCYIVIFLTARQTTRESGRSSSLKEDIRMAKKMFLLVLTDFCCWVPIGVLSILAQAGAVEVNPVAYAWIATFILPINSSINPFLYTLGDVIANKVSCSCTLCKTQRSDEDV